MVRAIMGRVRVIPRGRDPCVWSARVQMDATDTVLVRLTSLVLLLHFVSVRLTSLVLLVRLLQVDAWSIWARDAIQSSVLDTVTARRTTFAHVLLVGIQTVIARNSCVILLIARDMEFVKTVESVIVTMVG